jgi:branched-chain amino acid transport system permease protein
MDYFIQCAVLAAIYGILAISMDMVAGQAGLLSIVHAGFFGIGAYASAFLTLHTGCDFAVGVIAGACIAVAVSFIFSLPTLRLNDDYFVIGTFAFQMILFSVLNNWTSVTRGSLGIRGIPSPTIFGCKIDTSTEFLILACCCLLFVLFAVYRITSSPFGRVLHAIREDEVFAKAHGKNTLYFKVTAFAVSAALAAMAGSLYAHYITYIDPTTFTMMDSILILSMVIIGGAGSLWGPLVGAVVLIALPEALRFIGLSSAVTANMRQIIYGCLLVIMMMFRPRGLVGKYGFNK